MKLLNINEVAERLQCDAYEVFLLRNRGILTGHGVGRHVKFEEDEVERYANERRAREEGDHED